MNSTRYLSFIVLAFAYGGSPTTSSAFAISSAEADTIIANEAATKLAREMTIKARLENAPALEESIFFEGENRMVVRRIEPPPQPANKIPLPISSIKTRATTILVPTDGREWKSMSPFFITVYADHFSEIRWRDFTVWSETDFSALPAFGNIEAEQTTYSWFALVSERPEIAAIPTEVVESFSGATGYTVLTPNEAEVPEELLAEMDLLHLHYLAHEKKYQAERQRAKTLQTARERYLQENPPEPKDDVLNFWPIRSNLYPTTENDSDDDVSDDSE